MKFNDTRYINITGNWYPAIAFLVYDVSAILNRFSAVLSIRVDVTILFK